MKKKVEMKMSDGFGFANAKSERAEISQSGKSLDFPNPCDNKNNIPVPRRRLGDYIREVNVRNTDLAVTKLLGLSMTKQFRPSTSNIIGVDLGKYKIVGKNVFAFDPMSVIRVHKVPIALNNTESQIIVSPAYTTFECSDTNRLNPQYLMMLFQRSEFDRYADFKSDAAVRGGYDWKELCDTIIPVPAISVQRQIVAEYETVSRRIALNERLCSALESAAQTLYRHTFVDNIDPAHLPTGWRMGTLGEFCKEMKSGGTPNRSINEYWDKKDLPWLKTGEVQNNIVIEVEEYISQKGLENSSAKLIPAGSVVMAMYGATAAQIAYLNCSTTTNQACCNMICHTELDSAFLFFHLLFHQAEIKRMANGGAQENLSQELIARLPILLLQERLLLKPFATMLARLVFMYSENHKLRQLQTLLLSKLGRL